MEKKRISQHHDETAFQYLSRVVSNLKFEECSELDCLPSVEAVLDYFDLWTTYDTDLLVGIIDALENGEDPSPYNSFVKKHDLGWRLFVDGQFVDDGASKIQTVGGD